MRNLSSPQCAATAGCWPIRRQWVAMAALWAACAAAASVPAETVTAKRKALVEANSRLKSAGAELRDAKSALKNAEDQFDAGALDDKLEPKALAKRAVSLRQAADKVAMLRIKEEAAEVLRDDARQVLYDALAEKPADREKRSGDLNEALTKARDERKRPVLDDANATLLADAARAQEMVTKIKANSEQAFALTDEGSALALAMALEQLKTADGKVKDDVNALLALQDAAAGRLVALHAHEQRGGAQKLGNLVVNHASLLAECKLDDGQPGCDQLPTDSQDLLAALSRRSERAAADHKVAKLAKFTVQAREFSSDETKQRAALAYLQMVDRNPNAGWQFGGEAATLTAGRDGATASIRFSLKRFSSAFENDTTLTLSAPLAEQGRTRLLASAAGDRPDETSLRIEKVLVRNLNSGLNFFGNFNQFGAFAQVGRQRFSVADAADLKAEAGQTSRTTFSVGASNLFGFANASNAAQVNAVHRVGFQMQRGYKAGDEITRCPTQPEPGETTLSCVTASFDPVKVQWKRTLNYRYRKEFGGRVAIAPAFSYEHTKRTKTYDLPVYLVQGGGDEQGKFTAGIAYRHVSTPGKETTKGWELFVTSPLSLLGP